MANFIAYCITNQVNGKRYIGITKRSLTLRFSGHVLAAQKGGHNGLRNAIRKYGAEAFKIEHIASAFDRDSLLDLECLLIAQEGTLTPHGYNLTTGGEQTEFAPEVLEAMRLRCADPAWLEKMTEMQRKNALDPDWLRKNAAARENAMATAEWREAHRLGTERKIADPEWQEAARRRAQYMCEDPVSLEKRRHYQRNRTPEHATNQARAAAETARRPEVLAGRSDRHTKLWADPVWKNATALKIKAARNDPAKAEFRSACSRAAWETRRQKAAKQAA